MLKSTELILEKGFSHRVIRDVDLSTIFQGTAARRYGLVNKAIKAKELIRLSRGYYILNVKYQINPLSQYYIANQIVPFSFISAESALSYHGWIPERVSQVTSMSAFGRNKQFHTDVGDFVYFVPPVRKNNFLRGVHLLDIEKRSTWMANPLRALIDYIYWHKIDNADSNFLRKSLRIDDEFLNAMVRQDIIQLKSVYQSKRIKLFLEKLLSEMNNGK